VILSLPKIKKETKSNQINATSVKTTKQKNHNQKLLPHVSRHLLFFFPA